jgi:hypothetical protein
LNPAGSNWLRQKAGRQATMKNALSRPERFGLSLDEAESIVYEL